MPTLSETVAYGIMKRYGGMTPVEAHRRMYIDGDDDKSRYYLDGKLVATVTFKPGDIGRVPNWEIMWHAAA